VDYLDKESFFGGQVDALLDQMTAATKCEKFCREWRDSNREQVECVTGLKARLVYCKRVGPGKYELEFQIGKKTVNWFGTACCSFAAMAKAYQEYYNENPK